MTDMFIRRLVLISAICTLLFLFGCGGSSGGSKAPAPEATSVAAFAGAYSGTYTGADSGTVTVTLATNGSIAGNGTSSIDPTYHFTISGQVAAGGNVSLQGSGTAGTATFTGTVTSQGVLAGTWSSAGGNGTFATQKVNAVAAKGTVIGLASDNTTGLPVAGVTVTDGTVTATTAADGTFTLANSAAGADKVITFTKANYTLGSKITTLAANVTERVDISMLPVTYTTTITSQAAPQTLSVPSSAGQVQLPASALVSSSGTAPSGTITANMTPIDPSSNPQIMPGNYTTSGDEAIQSYGAMEVTFNDASGNQLNLASGKSATIRIPVAASETSPPATMPAFYYNRSTGKWVQEGTLTLAGTAPNRYYTGTVTHFSNWNADQVYNTACINGKVVKADGITPQSNAKVEAQGRDYTGNSQAWTAADGTFSIKVKANSSVIITASSFNSQSQSIVFTSSAAGSACTDLFEDLVMGSTTASGSAKIKLTWGTNPNDLDSHLSGPLSTGSRFHVYYSNAGTLTAAPFAALDVDDTSSFGPEVITINNFVPGTYRYSVHHFSGSGNISSSPARVELLLNGVTRVFTPPSPGSTVLGPDSVWVVFELVVSSTGTVTVNPVNTYLTGIADSSVTKQAYDTFDEHFLFRNLPGK